MTELHVIADERTTWRVYATGTAVALTEHTNATDAELAARALADDHGAKRVVVHDRALPAVEGQAACLARRRRRPDRKAAHLVPPHRRVRPLPGLGTSPACRARAAGPAGGRRDRRRRTRAVA